MNWLTHVAASLLAMAVMACAMTVVSLMFFYEQGIGALTFCLGLAIGQGTAAWLVQRGHARPVLAGLGVVLLGFVTLGTMLA